jgi:hypothetical protein
MIPIDDVEKGLDRDKLLREIREKTLQGLKEYEKVISLMACDAPLSVLCIPKIVEKTLNENGIHRVYELLHTDFIKIEALSVIQARDLTARLDQFITML